ncbi:hypothetical protein PAXRUDRAFT_834672 [Paxillus rubicundulus Ve08.2h10]|uniref:Uncharacterized protein n=1 Tax=Paxillus rubicundulus Ve08.2h10 TaxID=930991 RepID=A0A0D0DJ91_9AGAM|nr:hypothetical protein PAXRUDRAFT_834672 [Paxillus rubicundulus Ve08.2h10]
MDSSRVEVFKGDQHAAAEEMKKYGTGTEECIGGCTLERQSRVPCNIQAPYS